MCRAFFCAVIPRFRYGRTMIVAVVFYLALVWGANFIFMKWAVEYISPGQIVLVRVIPGFLVVLAFGVLTRQFRREHLRYAHHFLVMGCLAASFYYYAFAVGTSLLPSGIAGVISGAVPIFATIAGVIFLRDEPLGARKAAAILIGFVGIVLLARPFGSAISATTPEGVLYMVAGSLSFGASFVYARKFLSPLGIGATALAAYQLGFAILIQFAVTDVPDLRPLAADPLAFWSLLLGVGVFGTGGAFMGYYYIVDRLGVFRASAVTFLPPVVALFIGAVLVNEPITALDYIASALILGGVLLLRRR